MDSIMKAMLTAALPLAICMGCVTVEKYPTASGFPETTISAKKSTVKAAIVNKMVGKGWSLGETDEFKVALEYDNSKEDSLAANTLAEFVLLEEGGKVHVIAKLGILFRGNKVWYEGKYSDNTPGGRRWVEIEQCLVELKTDLEKAK